jgi:acyl-coenzyme A thioesterase PaaI-like protein
MTQTIPFDPEQRRTMADNWSAHPGMRHMSARADFTDPALVKVVIDPLEPHHRGGLGTAAVNGAVLAGMFDVAIGMVGHFQMIGRRAGTAQLNMHFVRPLTGDRVEVVAWLVRAGRNLVFAAAEARDEQGTVCARGDGIVAASGAAEGDNQAL